MGVSFKVARTGTRYRPKPGLDDNLESEDVGTVADTQERLHQGNYSGKGDKVADQASVSVKYGVHLVSEDLEVSFSINLFPNGFSVGETTEVLTDVPKQLHPYDRASETLFTSIEYGWLPGDIFDGISCKYVNGAILCEIRDYRNCLWKSAGTASAFNSPIIHKVSLQMCMENVIRDIISLSNDSWTYKDLLEVESCILKALQPVLHLNPEPSIERSDRGSLTKKLDLGITWSWKRKKINDATTSDPRFSNQCNRGVPSSQLTISSSIPNIQKNVIVPESISQPNFLTKEPNYQLAERCAQSIPTVSRLSNLPSVPKQRFSECNHDRREPSSLVFPEQGTCETEANNRPILKVPKEEPIDFSQQQAAVSQSDNTLAVNLQLNTLLHQKAEKNRHERFNERRGFLVFQNNDQQAVFEGNRKLQAGMLAHAVKQEPVETSDHPILNAKNIKDKYFIKDVRSNQTNLQQLHLQRSSPILGTSITPPNARQDQMVYDKNARKQVRGQKRKALQNPQVTDGMSIVVISSHQNESLPSEVSLPAKQKKSSQLKVSSSASGDLLAVTNNGNTTSYFQLQNSDLPHTSEVKADPILERFLKIKAVAQRYGLSNRKCKLDKTLSQKLDFSNTARVEYHLLNPVENWKSKDAITTVRIPLSECFVDRKLNESKTRTLIYVHQSHLGRGLQIPMVDGNAYVKLVMSEILNKGFVEASVLYEHKQQIASTRIHILPFFGSSYSADHFASQFTSLEGYCLVHDRIESTPFHGDGCSSTQVATVSGTVPAAAGAIRLPSSTLTAGVPKMQLGIATQGSPVQQWQHCMNKEGCLQFQMMEIQRQQNQILQRMTMVGGLGTAAGGPGMVHYGGGIRDCGNIGHGSLTDLMSIGGSVKVPRGGQFPWLHNVSPSNNIGSNIPSSSGSKLSFSGITDNAFQVLATWTANNQGRALMGGYPFQRNAGTLSMQTPSIQDMAYLLTNQLILPQNQHIQGIRPVIQPKVENSLPNDYFGNTSILSLNRTSPSDQVNSKLLNIHHQINQLHASSGSAVPQRNNRNVVFSPGSPQESSLTRRSVASSNVSSSSTLSALSRNKGAVKTERE